ncbi:MAG TPA: FAD-dependent monooxygenase [Burkholderiales bacterium]|nr:FAD-dependent monooxygenase [Burkholderiales bacterium]
MPGRALDLAVLGGGPVGCAFALGLHGSGHQVAIFEQRGHASGAVHGERPIALSYASRLILERLGAWPQLASTAIDTIHVSQAGGFGRTRLEAREAGVPALGYVVGYGPLEQALVALAERRGIEIVHEAIFPEREYSGDAVRLRGTCGKRQAELTARCVVHAEGAAGDAHEKRYAQVAVVGVLVSEPRAGSTAFERFTAEGPLALLPMAGRYALVWAMRPERAAALAAAPAQDFLGELGQAFGGRAGRLVAIEQRTCVPLVLRTRTARRGVREAHIGNAAQTLHPVAGQGLNLGLRDAWDLARALRESADPGDARALADFASQRRLDAAVTVRVTDLLAGAFLGANPVGRLARGCAMSALDGCAPARRFFARRMIFGPSAMP